MNTYIIIAIVDEGGDFFPYLEEQAGHIPMEITDYRDDLETLTEAMMEGHYDGYLVFSEEGLLKTGSIPYYVSEARNVNMEVVYNFFDKPVTIYRLEKVGLTPEQIAVTDIPLNIIPTSVGGEETTLYEVIVPVAVAMILVFAIVFSGQILMYGVIREKRNRIIEILLSSISSMDLMLGKILGFGVLGLMQVTIWVTVGLIVGSFFIDIFQYIPMATIIPSLFIFVFGYMMLAAMFAAAGATMKDAEGGSQMQGLVIMIPMIPLFISGPIFMNPDAFWVRLLSYVPPFSPIGALMRSGATNIPGWEMVLILTVMLASGLLFVYLGSKIFEGSILQYDRNISFGEVRRMLRGSNR